MWIQSLKKICTTIWIEDGIPAGWKQHCTSWEGEHEHSNISFEFFAYHPDEER